MAVPWVSTCRSRRRASPHRHTTSRTVMSPDPDHSKGSDPPEMMSPDLIHQHHRLRLRLWQRITDPRPSDRPDPPEWHLMRITPATTATTSRPLQDLSMDLQVDIHFPKNNSKLVTLTYLQRVSHRFRLMKQDFESLLTPFEASSVLYRGISEIVHNCHEPKTKP